MVSFDLRTKENVDNLKYHLTKNWYNASHLDAQLLKSIDLYFHQIWTIHQTWELLSDGIEDISNTIAQTIIVQHISNYQPYINDEILDLNE